MRDQRCFFEVVKAKRVQDGPLLVINWGYNSYKWPYEWVTGVITLLIGVYITGRGPPCMVSFLRCFFETKVIMGKWQHDLNETGKCLQKLDVFFYLIKKEAINSYIVCFVVCVCVCVFFVVQYTSIQQKARNYTPKTNTVP